MYDPAEEKKAEERRQLLYLSVRYVDGGYHLCATNCEVEHTHSHAFEHQWQAYDFLRKVETALAGGRDFNFAHWWSTSLH